MKFGSKMSVSEGGGGRSPPARDTFLRRKAAGWDSYDCLSVPGACGAERLPGVMISGGGVYVSICLAKARRLLQREAI